MAFLQTPHKKYLSQIMWHQFYLGQQQRIALLYPQAKMRWYASPGVSLQGGSLPQTVEHLSGFSLQHHLVSLGPVRSGSALESDQSDGLALVYGGVGVQRWSPFQQHMLHMYRVLEQDADRRFIDFTEDLLLKADGFLREIFDEWHDSEWVMGLSSYRFQSMECSLQDLKKMLSATKSRFRQWKKGCGVMIPQVKMAELLYREVLTLGMGLYRQQDRNRPERGGGGVPWGWRRVVMVDGESCGESDDGEQKDGAGPGGLEVDLSRKSHVLASDYSHARDLWQRYSRRLHREAFDGRSCRLMVHTPHPYESFAFFDSCDSSLLQSKHFACQEVKRWVLGYDMWADYLMERWKGSDDPVLHVYVHPRGRLQWAWVGTSCIGGSDDKDRCPS